MSALADGWAYLSTVFDLGLNVALKSMLLLSGAVLLHMALRHVVVAQVRATVWNAIVVLLLTLPFVAWLAPAWHVPAPELTTPLARAYADVRPTLTAPLLVTRPDINESTIAAAEVARAGDSAEAPAAGANAWRVNWSLVTWFAVGAIYLAGVLLLSVRGWVALRCAERLRQLAEPLDDQRWQRVAARAQRELGINRVVTLATAEGLPVPATIGWRRPVVFVPRELVAQATPTEREAILVHELAHVRRNDYLWHLLLLVTRALYWPNPLIWLAGGHIAATREQACDQYCVHYLGGVDRYANVLLDVAQSLATRRRTVALGLGIAMATRSRLAQRLTSMANGCATPHCVSGWICKLLITTPALAGIGLLGPLQIQAATAGLGSLVGEGRLARLTSVGLSLGDDLLLYEAQPAEWAGALRAERLVIDVAGDHAAAVPRLFQVISHASETGIAEFEFLGEHPLRSRHGRAAVEATLGCAKGRPIDVACQFTNALYRGDWEAIDAMVIQRMAQRTPQSWRAEHRLVRELLDTGPAATLPAPELFRGDRTATVRLRLGERALVIVAREIYTDLWGVCAVLEAHPYEPLSALHSAALAWSVGERPNLPSP